ncbi:MAG TPA: hypothetical protein VK213_02310 [Bacteroidales bacterium]|nr:hypothetical protein [Bacteroidales bacterium]
MQKIKYLGLLILPLMFLVNVFWNNKTEFEQDPNYMYMFNALNLTTHPGSIATYTQGTTAVEISAVIMRVHHMFRNTDDSFTDDVLKNPQLYIMFVVRTMVVLICILLFASGFFIAKLTDEIIFGILFQSFPVFSGTVMPWALESFAAEPVILACVSCFVLLILWRFYFGKSSGHVVIFRRKETEISVDKFSVLSGVLMGFCLATKVNTFSLLLLPVILLPEYRDKITFLAVSCLSYIFFTLPVAYLYKLTAAWYLQVFIHSGIYGGGSANIVDFASLAENLRVFLKSETIIVFVISLSVIFLLIRVVLRKYDNDFKLLLLFLLVQVIAILAVLKHFYLYYLMPVVPTLAVNIFLILRSARLPYAVRVLSVAAVIIAGFSMNGDFNIRKTNFYSTDEPSDGINIYSYQSDSPLYALKLGDDASRNANSEKLKELYGDHYFYDIWNKIIITWTDTISIEELSGSKIYLHALDEYMKELPPPFGIEYLEKGLYLVKAPGSNSIATSEE